MLNVLDGAVLVISAVEGVQAQTRILLRTLRRLRIPTLIFANKVDRSGARDSIAARRSSAEAQPGRRRPDHGARRPRYPRRPTVRPLGAGRPGHVER